MFQKKIFASLAYWRLIAAVSALLENFLSPTTPALKICGVTSAPDAEKLAQLGVEALGINFWDQSRRYCPPESAARFLPGLSDRILRVGVFVNADPDLPRKLLTNGIIDIAQFHGDEDLSYCEAFADAHLPFFKAIGMTDEADLPSALDYPASALLLDAHAPGLYGGTGRTIDWKAVARFINNASPPPVILAGGITPGNATEALLQSRACALDVASGAESSPGEKDFNKIRALLASVRSYPSNAE